MSENNDELEVPENFSKVALGLLAGLVILGVVVYGAYTYSKKGGQTVLPSGFPAAQTVAPVTLANLDCAKTTKSDPNNPWPYYIKCSPFRVSTDTKWVPFTENTHGFSFDLPESLKTSAYPNGLGVSYNEIQPQNNLLYSLDQASSRSGEFKSMTIANYPENYWRQFSGLTSLKSVTRFTNSKNVKGARAMYVNVANETPSTEVFFEFPTKPGDFVHFGTGILSIEVFNTIVDSFKFTQ